MLPPVAPSSWYESDALGLSFWATNPKLAVRPDVWEAIWPPPVIFSAPGGGGGGWLAQEPVVTTKPAVAASWWVKFARIFRRVVGLSAPWAGPTSVVTLLSSENAPFAKCCRAKASWKRSARLR